MKPIIRKSSFGSIQIDEKKYDHDVVISLDGSIRKRKKKLSKEVFGTSHIISLAEAEDIYESGAELLIIGSGVNNLVKLSNEAAQYFEDHQLKAVLDATPRAADKWNLAEGKVIGLFHITC